LEALRQRPDQVVIATLGAQGAIALIGNQVVEVKGRAVPVVDTTGAGDCFVGALAAALCSWADVDEAVHFANLAASFAVQRPGAGTAMPHLADIEALA
jgi:ribokinase